MMPELGVILDAGTGMFRARDLIETDTLHILLSHVHLDHSIGITFLFDVLWDKKVEKVFVYSEPDKIEALEQHLFAEPLFPARPDFEFRAHQPELEIEGTRIETFPLKHPGGSVGFLFEHDGRKMAYVTDTTADPGSDYLDRIQGVDLLIHECYFPDGWEDRAELTGHSCLSPVCEVAKKCGAGELILVHINPLDENAEMLDLESAREIYPSVSVAQDHQVVDW